MLLQRMKLTLAVVAAAGLVAAGVAQAQTSSQTPPPAKPKAQTAAPAAPAPQGQPQGPPPGAGQAMRPSRGGMGPGMGQGMGPGMGPRMGPRMGPGMGQGMGWGMGQGFGAPMGNRGMRGQLMWRGMARLNLTQAQKDQMKAFRDLQQKDAQAVRERMEGARQKLQEAMKADVPDEAAVTAAAGAMATAQSEQIVLHARAKAQLMKVLTPEQQTQLKQQRARMNQMARRQMQRGMARRRRGWI